MKHSRAEEEIEERASLYVLGALTAEEARDFEEHLADGCEVCQAELDSFETVAASLGATAPAAAPSPAVREKLTAFLREEAQAQPTGASFQSKSPLQTLTIRADEGDWQEVSTGVLKKQLFADQERGTVTSLFRLLPGARVPRHRHDGTEECLVISGDLHANDEVLGPGDYHCAPAGSVHETLATIQGALFLIVAQAS